MIAISMRRTPARLVALVLVSSLVACSEPPRRAPMGPAPVAASTAAASPAESEHPDDSIRIAGVVELHGALATPPAEAVLFVSVKPREGEFASMPALTLRIELAGFASGAADVLRVPFEVTGEHTMAGGPPLTAAQLPPTCDVEALYDPTGGLRDKERLVRQRVPVDGHAATGVTVVLRAD